MTGSELKKLRKDAGLSIAELAKKINIATHTLDYIERKKKKEDINGSLASCVYSVLRSLEVDLKPSDTKTRAIVPSTPATVRIMNLASIINQVDELCVLDREYVSRYIFSTLHSCDDVDTEKEAN